MGILLKSRVDATYKGKSVVVTAENTDTKERFYIGTYPDKQTALLKAPTILQLKMKNPSPKFKAFLDGKKTENIDQKSLK